MRARQQRVIPAGASGPGPAVGETGPVAGPDVRLRGRNEGGSSALLVPHRWSRGWGGPGSEKLSRWDRGGSGQTRLGRVFPRLTCCAGARARPHWFPLVIAAAKPRAGPVPQPQRRGRRESSQSRGECAQPGAAATPHPDRSI